MADATLLLLPWPAAGCAVTPCCCSSARALQPLRLDVKRLQWQRDRQITRSMHE
jgi:hypothetical protein